MKMRGDHLMGTRWLLLKDDSCDRFELPMEPEPRPNQTLPKIASLGRPLPLLQFFLYFTLKLRAPKLCKAVFPNVVTLVGSPFLAFLHESSL